MAQPATKEGSFSYADYLTWPEEERWELIEGQAHAMTPAPSTTHQRVLRRLLVQIDAQLKQTPCEVFAAPLDVRLPEKDSSAADAIRSVVQPDLLVVCGPDKLDHAGCLGAPELVIEILSPATSFRDQTHKLLLYQKHGVQEYWIVNAQLQSVQVYCMGPDGRFGKVIEYRQELLPATAVGQISIDLDLVFQP